MAAYLGALGDRPKEIVEGQVHAIQDGPVGDIAEKVTDAFSPGDEGCYFARSDSDSVQVLDIEPAPGTFLEAGQIVDVTAKVRYYLDSHDTAEIELYYLLPPEHEGEKYSGGSAGFAKREISGRGTVKLRGSFEVPDIAETEIAVQLQPTISDVRAGGYDCWASMDRASAATVDRQR